jgi:hypothetical protein
MPVARPEINRSLLCKEGRPASTNHDAAGLRYGKKRRRAALGRTRWHLLAAGEPGQDGTVMITTGLNITKHQT